MASPLHRHQSSLEGVIDFSSSPQPLEPDQRSRAVDIFNRIVAQYEPSPTNAKDYKRITLLRAVYDSVIAKDDFLRCFFLFLEKELRQGEDAPEQSYSQALSRFIDLDSRGTEQGNALEASLAAFSDYLVDNFFLTRTIYVLYVGCHTAITTA
ncbi:hypothetical protein VTN96DRAFT_5195 [Rasamsonia emersonii]